MSRPPMPPERHRMARIGWLRAAVLGANDGILSTASLMVGVAATAASADAVLVAGLAGLVAGAMSMAAGEYVSVSSQSDTERAELAMEAREQRDDPSFEQAELAAIYVGRGLTPALAGDVAKQLMARDALGAHARDELGMSEITAAQPVQAALASAAAFTAGAAVPVAVPVAVAAEALAPAGWLVPLLFAAALLCLVALGAVGARAGGAPIGRGIARIAFWGALAMGSTAGIGLLIP
jgi:VIT1/CCC1 family predicted Fe2+/Mn2+ transporter